MSDAGMIVVERKSKYKHKITFTGTDQREQEMSLWCEEMFGPGGRKWRWRFGWIGKDTTFYFKDAAEASLFVLRWS